MLALRRAELYLRYRLLISLYIGSLASSSLVDIG